MCAHILRRPIVVHYALAWLIALASVAIAVASFILNPPSSAAMGAMVQHINASRGYPNILTIAGEVVKAPLLFIVFLYAAAPSLAALIVASRGGGGGLKPLFSRLRPVGPQGRLGPTVTLYAVMLCVYAMGFAAFAFNAGPGVDTFVRLRWLGGSAVLGALAGLFLDEGGSLEELGWRGFEWPLLQAAFKRPLAAACVLGVLHWAWHLPREIPTLIGGPDLGAWAVGQFSFLILCLALSIVAVFCVNRSGGSIWPAVFVHGGSNVWSKACDAFVTDTFGEDLRTWLLILLALLIVIFARRRMGRRADESPITVEPIPKAAAA